MNTGLTRHISTECPQRKHTMGWDILDSEYYEIVLIIKKVILTLGKQGLCVPVEDYLVA